MSKRFQDIQFSEFTRLSAAMCFHGTNRQDLILGSGGSHGHCVGRCKCMDKKTAAGQIIDEDSDAAMLRLLLTAADLRDVTERMRVRLSMKIQRKLEEGRFAMGHRESAGAALDTRKSA